MRNRLRCFVLCCLHGTGMHGILLNVRSRHHAIVRRQLQCAAVSATAGGQRSTIRTPPAAAMITSTAAWRGCQLPFTSPSPVHVTKLIPSTCARRRCACAPAAGCRTIPRGTVPVQMHNREGGPFRCLSRVLLVQCTGRAKGATSAVCWPLINYSS